MYSDPKDCLYCTNNETLHNLMIEICHLRVSRAFLFKEQTYHGRCLVAYDKHVNDLNELDDEQRNLFMAGENQLRRIFRQTESPAFPSGAEICGWSGLRWHLPNESGRGLSDRSGIRRNGSVSSPGYRSVIMFSTGLTNYESRTSSPYRANAVVERHFYLRYRTERPLRAYRSRCRIMAGQSFAA